VNTFIVVDAPIAIPLALDTFPARVVNGTIEKGETSGYEILVGLGTANT
jgi:hypothetical protein